MNARTAPATFVVDATLRVGPQSRREVIGVGLSLPQALSVSTGDFTPIAEIVTAHWARLDFEVTHAKFSHDDLLALAEERVLRARMEWEDERA